MYHIIRLFAHFRKFVPEIVPLWLKNRNQRFDTGWVYARVGLYADGLARGGAYT